MAATAIEAEFIVVNIVGPVAIIATTPHLHLYIERLPMAGLAIGVAMGTIQGEGRFRIVIEAPPGPVDR